MTENEEFEKNFGLVVSQAIRFKDGAMCDRDDYIQAGSIGLIKALRGYDAAQGSLSTFAYNAIRNEILQEIKKDKNKARTINFEPSYSLISKITEFIPKLTDMQYEILLLRLENHTYAEIGANYKKSKEWAREELCNIISIIRKANEEKILFKNEAHFINSGYGGYGRELMMNLHKTGKYELAQLATYASPNDGRLLSVPWKCYGNAPASKSGPEFDAYSSNRINEYGLWRWEDTVLDFKPDYVMGINDIWGDLFTLESPLREYYNLAWMSTVDARPQEESWIASFTELDGLLCYSDFGGDVIKEQGGDRIKYFGSAGGGPDLNVFKPMLNKAEYKKQMAGSDCFLVGTVMRNQKESYTPT